MDRRTCIFTVQVRELNSVWPLESGEFKSKAVISFKFPGSAEEADSVFESHAVSPISPESSEVSPPANDGGNTKAASFSTDIASEFKRVSDWPLWNGLLQQPLLIFLHWISPSGKTKREIGKVRVDLSGLLLQETQIQGDFSIGDANAEKSIPSSARKEEKEPPNIKGKKPQGSAAAAQEIPPDLLHDSNLNLIVSTDIPILTLTDREESLIMELGQISLRSVPPLLLQKGLQATAESDEEDIFSYSLAFKIPGFAGFSWWSSVTGIAEETKRDIEIGILGNGKIEYKLTEKGEIKSEKSDKDVLTDVAESPAASEEQTEGILTWNGNIRRFLPGKAVKELKGSIWKGTKWRGEVARCIKPDKTGLCDPNFDKYHGKFEIDLSILLEEGVLETTIRCSVESCEESNTETDVLLSAPPPNSERSASLNAVEEEGSPDSTERPSNNAWNRGCSSIMICIKMSSPLEPIWVALPEPDLQLSDIIPPRPKLSKVEKDLEAASKEFLILINSIRQLLMKLLNNESMQSVVDSLDRTKRNETIIKLLLHELNELGLVHQIRSEMKDIVLKVAAEKFKLDKIEFVDHGKFEFYNSLYIDLMLGIQKGIQEPMAIGDYRSANKYHQERIFQERNEPDVWFQYGIFCMRGADRDHDKAEECFRECICLEKDHALSLFSLACLMWHRGLLDQAEVLLRSVLELHPSEFIPWSILSLVLKLLGEKELCPYARMDLGNCYLHLQYYGKALDLFLKGCVQNPSSGMFLGVGIAFYHMGDMANAETALLEANILDPSNFKTWAFIALICLATERMDEAGIAFEQALKTFPNATLLKELASAFASKGNYRNAVIALSEALKEEESSETRLHLANMLYSQGRIDIAKTEYGKIIQQEDTPDEVRERASAALDEVLSAERRTLENASTS